MRTAIRTAALALWAVRPFRAAPPVAAIAESAGVAPGTIYLYYRSKEQLLRDVVDELARDLASRLSAALDSHSPRGSRATFRAIWTTTRRFHCDRPGALELLLMYGERGRPRGEAVLSACPRLEQWLRTAAAEGSLVFRDPAEAWALLPMILLAAPPGLEAQGSAAEDPWCAAAWRAVTGTW